MAISGVGQSYYQNNVATTKSTKSVNSTGETGNTKELSEAEEMAIFKKEFYAEIVLMKHRIFRIIHHKSAFGLIWLSSGENPCLYQFS